MQATQFIFAHAGVALIDAVSGAAVAHPVLHTGYDGVGAHVSLQAFHESSSIPFYNFRVFRITLVDAAPLHVARHGKGGGEGPLYACSEYLAGCNLGNALQQVGIVGATQPDVVGKDGGSKYVVVTMDGIHAIERRYAVPGFTGGRPICIVHGHPIGKFILPGTRATAAQNGADVVLPHLFRTDRHPFGLDHLANLLLQRHFAEQFLCPFAYVLIAIHCLRKRIRLFLGNMFPAYSFPYGLLGRR